MTAPKFDFSHLSPVERIELAERLWDSVEPAPGALDEALVTELRRRRSELATDEHAGEPGNQVLDDIAARGT